MLAVSISSEEARPLLDSINSSYDSLKLSVSCFNSPRNVTISGQENQISRLENMLNAAGIFNRRLRVSIAYHSPQMKQVAREYLGLMGTLSPGSNEHYVPMISSVDGRRTNTEALLQGRYWVQNMEAPVQFHEAMRTICSNSARRPTFKIDGSHRQVPFVNSLVEIGPSSVLHAPITECLKEYGLENTIACSSVLERNQSALHTFLGLAGHLYGLGAGIDLRKVNDPCLQFSDDRIALSDLPGYPFNHATTYWYESRLSADRRLRNHGHVDVLGTPVSDWNPLDAQWRNIINADDIRWVEDHHISGACLCPGAAMVVMALEAARQLADPEQPISGYELREVVFGVALDLSASGLNLETRFSVRSSNGRWRQHGSWSTFSVYSLVAQRWTEHCRGCIRVCYQDSSEGDNFRSQDLVTRYRRAYLDKKRRCTRSVAPSTMYQFLHERSIEYGPAFQRMRRIWCSNDQEIITDIGFFEADEERGSKLHIIHPTTLDAILHSVFAAQSRGGMEDIATQVPSKIGQLWIASEGLNQSGDASVSVSTAVDAATPLTITSSSIVLDQKTTDLQLVITGLEMSQTNTAEPPAHVQPGKNQIWCRLQAFLDIDLLTNQEASLWLNHSCTSVQEEPVVFYNRLRSLLRRVVCTTRNNLSTTVEVDSGSYLQKYFGWMDWQMTIGCETVSKDDERHHIIVSESEIGKEGAIGHLYSEVANKLDGILNGQTDARQLLFEDSLVKGFYDAQVHSSACFARLQKYITARAIKGPTMRILEVGAGTGVFTKVILEALSGRAHDPSQPQKFSEYHFTDISPAFFEPARKEFSAYNQKMMFRTLDIEKDIDIQAQEESSYDLIIAANVLHITRYLASPLRNLRKLLKAGGKMIIHETTTPDDITTGFIFGLLPEWWQATEPNRRYSPLVTEHDWNQVLKETGFSGTDIVLRDFEHEACHQSSIMISTAVDSSHITSHCPAMIIVIDQQSSVQNSMARGLQEQLYKSESYLANILSLKEACKIPSTDMIVIMLMEMETPMLQRLEQLTFLEVQGFFRSNRRILWITGGGGAASEDPGHGLIDGFSRALCLEKNDLKLVTLALEPVQNTINRQISRILQVLKVTILNPENSNFETEYVEINGALHVRRIMPAEDLRHDMLERLSRETVVLQTFHDSTPIQVRLSKPGDVDSIGFEAQKDSASHELEADEIEIEVKAIGLGINDLSQTLGAIPSVGYGNQCAGIVSRVGNDAIDDCYVGQRVCTLGTNLCQPFIRSKKELVASIADSLSFEMASTLPFDLWLGYYLVDKLARVAATDAVLVHGAASTLGMVCLALLRKSTSSVFATATSEEAYDILQQRSLFPHDHILRGHVIPEDLKKALIKKGFDVILDVSNDNELSTTVSCLAPFGRVIYLMPTSLTSDGQLVLPWIQSNITISAVDPTSLLDAYMAHSNPLQQIIDQVPLYYFRVSNIVSYQIPAMAEALRHLKQQHGQIKTVICLDKQDQVFVTKAVEDKYMFDANATYLISGGLGGLGRCIARWMTSRGARNLVLLSRSGPRSTAAHEMLAELTSHGIRVETPPCDAADLEALRLAVCEISKSMPPIKGCIQAAGAIQDTWFDDMSYEDWVTATRPKVDGSWNLHTVLPRGLDFFILTASISGIFGQITQVNYASGNTYQDALARYRHAHGEKAVSLDLGLLLIDGLLKDKPDLVKRLNNTGYFVPLAEAEILAIFDHYCDPNLEYPSPSDTQPIVGIQSPAILRSRGIELPASMQQPLWSMMASIDSGSNITPTTKDEETDLLASTLAAKTVEGAGAITTGAITNRIGQIMSIEPEKLDISSPIHSFGVDSLSAVDIRNWISKIFAVQISTFEILGNNSLTELGQAVARKLKPQDTKVKANMESDTQ
ncbi:MAG: hypothetical protein Q9209_004458 [Squamulea sp. 1 TL-2023]